MRAAAQPARTPRFFVVGAAKGRLVEHRWIRSGLETLTIGGTAAVLAWVVGALLGGRAG